MPLVRFLRSPRVALAILGFTAAWSAVGAWLPWSLPGGAPPPPWAAALGLDHPFATPVFLAAVALLFASVLACTWGKGGRIRRLHAGELPPSARVLALRPGVDVAAFLQERGFRPRGGRWIRFGAGLWGGWTLHVGLLALIGGVLVQQALYDTGLFELTEGETLRLDAPGALRWRQHGLLAPGAPPDAEVTLHWFDPYSRQDGYAPDRRSQLGIVRTGQERVTEYLDRAAGLRVGSLEFFQAIPTGFAVNLDVPGLGRRSVHLQPESERVASARVDDPAGRPGRFLLVSERPLGDPLGTGAIRLEFEQDGARRPLQRAAAFRFGDREATLLSVARWGQFTYVRRPAMAAVYAGFLLVLVGCALLAFPAGVARLGPPGENVAATVAVARGAEVIAAEWDRAGSQD